MPSADWPDLVSALIEQWTLIAHWAAGLDLAAPSVLIGWRNRDVITHLTQQAELLAAVATDSFPASAFKPTGHGTQGPRLISAAESVRESIFLAQEIDAVVRRDPEASVEDLAAAAGSAEAALRSTGPNALCLSPQGFQRVHAYVRSRCLAAVAHARDLQPPVLRSHDLAELVAATLATSAASGSAHAGGQLPLPDAKMSTDDAVEPVSPLSDGIRQLALACQETSSRRGLRAESLSFSPDQLVAAGLFMVGIRAGGALVGVCGSGVLRGGVMELQRLLVHPSSRGQGIADLLVDWQVGFAIDSGAEKIRLIDHPRQVPARAVFLRHGFRTVSPSARSASGGMSVFMEKDVAVIPY